MGQGFSEGPRKSGKEGKSSAQLSADAERKLEARRALKRSVLAQGLGNNKVAKKEKDPRRK